MKVVYMPYNGSPTIEEMDHTLEAMQTKVNGYIESLPLHLESGKVHLIINEEGLLQSLPINPHFFYKIYGNAFIVASEGDEFVSLNDNHVKELQKIIRNL